MPYIKEGSIYHDNTDFCVGGKKANPKQLLFLQQALNNNSLKYMAYGGAIRGGKSYVVLFILHQLCLKYPKSRWVTVRADLPVLKATTIPSFNKLIKTELYGKWNLTTNTFTYHNGSQIIFKSENIERDPELTSFLGMETNGLFLEQAEELSSKMWQKALERCGSWYIDPMPAAKIFTTFNPTQNWVKDMFYEPWRNGNLNAPYFFESALPKDNPHVTTDQWEGWANMAERYRQQFIEGDWTNFNDGDNLWAFAFQYSDHAGKPELEPEHLVYLSFDFNKNPICCSVIQLVPDNDGDNVLRVLETIKLAHSDIYALCDYILAYYPDNVFMVTGDASGHNTTALVQDNLHFYRVIQSKLMLSDAQMNVPSVNPRLEKNRLLVNSILAHHKVCIHEDKAKALIYDMRNVRMYPDGTIIKKDRTDPTQQADALDTFRYFCNTFMANYLKYST